MANRTLQLEPDDGNAPLYEAERGRLKPEARLPAARVLASQLGVNRNTVTAAFEELELQVWVRTCGERCLRRPGAALTPGGS
ncbi:MAG: GntR family transcriptional regulator [Myxococcota bacterium]